MPVTVTNNSRAVTAALKSAVADGLRDMGSMAADNARSTVHVITGNLRDSITYDSNDTEVVISAGMPYSGYEELGTSRQPAHPYLKPAVMNHTDELVNAFANAIKNAL